MCPTCGSTDTKKTDTTRRSKQNYQGRDCDRYVNVAYAAMPQQVKLTLKTPQRLNMQMDELWSFVADKGNEWWV